MTRLTLEPVSPGQIERLLPLIEAYYTHDSIPFKRERIQPVLDELLRTPTKGFAWLIQQHSLDVGYVIVTIGFDVEFGGPIAVITDLYIAPDFRAQGLGRAVMQRIEQACRERQLTALELQVSVGNTRAQSFYERLGFRSHRRIPMSKQLR